MTSRFIVSALGCSLPGTMGGNTKIAIEMARCLARDREVHVIVPDDRLVTFTANLPADNAIRFDVIAGYARGDKYHPVASCVWFRPRVAEALKRIGAGPNDVVFLCSDFHADVVPFCTLQPVFGYRLIPSVFLFIPSVFENIRNGYRFPCLKYIVYSVYQGMLFALAKRRATAFVVTNESDFARFPSRFTGRLFAYYGGVNVDQLPAIGALKPPSERTYDAIFCSRLHPQKGIDAFLDVWSLVLRRIPCARLAVIGNGEAAYEHRLREKARRLGLEKSVSWLGYVNNEAKYRLYADSRIHVHPTVFDNNGMVAAEALSTGLPVVMQDLPALRKIYATGCVKVPFGDRPAFAKALVTLLTDPAAYAAVAPTPEQVGVIRAHWAWESRAAAFGRWLDGLSPVPKGGRN